MIGVNGNSTTVYISRQYDAHTIMAILSNYLEQASKSILPSYVDMCRRYWLEQMILLSAGMCKCKKCCNKCKQPAAMVDSSDLSTAASLFFILMP